ncbi:MAG: aminotransferase class V-fold PLP-dependent enzyme [Bdellovibrionales bacterium]
MKKIREQFPALKQKFRGQDFIYLDSTNTTLKPQVVIDRIQKFYAEEASNVHRGGYQWSARTTENYEKARQHVAKFVGAASSDEIIFVRGTTEALNLVADTLGNSKISKGDEILISEMEHHANIVPWHLLQERKGLIVRAVRIHDNGELDLEDLKKKVNPRTKVVALTACSNTLGTITPIADIVQIVRQQSKAYVVIDGAQIVTQAHVDVQKLDLDFFVFSSHKVFGPTGIGIVYGKKAILDELPPYQGGGSMISQVTLEKTTFNDVPLRFEAGTPHIEGAIGLDAALSFIETVGWDDIVDWEQVLLREATSRLSSIPEVVLYGQARKKAPILAFNLKGAHHSDVAQVLDEMGIAVRAGHHCTQPLMNRLGITGCLRASFSIYNDLHDVQKLYDGVLKAKELLL